jgi:hypothetical protein
MRSTLTLTTLIILVTFFSSFGHAQIRSSVRDFALEVRPFDFTDKYYAANGIDTAFLRSRRNGVDGMSVFDHTEVRNFRDVRITATWPAYSPDGKMLFWNLYAEFDKDAIIIAPEGYGALDVAQAFPMFVFPSDSFPGSFRQSPMIRMSDGYFEKNPLGLAVAFSVRYTELVKSDKGAAIMKILAERNGISSDGTPIVRTADELDELSDLGMVEIRVRQDGPPFLAAKVMRYPDLGAITPDAYLVTVKQKDGSPLPAEGEFIRKFECLKDAKACAAYRN